MKVLLCSPIGAASKQNAGGIAVWADNVMDYYQQQKTDVEIEVLPYNRSVYIHVGMGLLSHLYYGVKDYVGLIGETRKRLRKGQFDVLHLCSSALLSLIRDYIVMRMAKRYGVKGVIHFHCGRIPTLALRKNWRWRLLKRVVAIADTVIVLDKESYTILRELGCKKVFEIPNPLSLSICEKIESYKSTLSRVPHQVVYVGHVLLSKGVFELVKACTAIEDLNLRIVGYVSDVTKNELMQLVNENKAQNRIHFIGEVSHDEVLREMLASDLFVFPSYTEGFPNVIIEAMACGCSIITTSVGAIPEMLSERGVPCGIIIPPRNVQMLENAMRELLDDEYRKKTLSSNASKRVREQYAMPHVWLQLESVWLGNH